jgi:1,4-alpha-glucan branching enzyme
VLDKRPGREENTVEVTFRVPHQAGGSDVHVVGDFNDWSTDATPMEPAEEGFVTCVELRMGRSYRFRYLVDGSRWENDWQADRYEPNEFGGEDSVVDLC